MIPRQILLAFLFLGVLGASTVRAHAIHKSVAEADYNAETRRLEVTVQVFADDFSDALGTHAGRKISLEKTPAAELDASIRAYLEDRFTVRAADGTLAPHRWVGRKLEDAANELWLFFEIDLPGGLNGARLRHAVLTEHFSDQINSIRVREGPRRRTLFFLPNDGEKAVSFPP